MKRLPEGSSAGARALSLIPEAALALASLRAGGERKAEDPERALFEKVWSTRSARPSRGHPGLARNGPVGTFLILGHALPS
jgi:hypothetical protein